MGANLKNKINHFLTYEHVIEIKIRNWCLNFGLHTFLYILIESEMNTYDLGLKSAIKLVICAMHVASRFGQQSEH